MQHRARLCHLVSLKQCLLWGPLKIDRRSAVGEDRASIFLEDGEGKKMAFQHLRLCGAPDSMPSWALLLTGDIESHLLSLKLPDTVNGQLHPIASKIIPVNVLVCISVAVIKHWPKTIRGGRGEFGLYVGFPVYYYWGKWGQELKREQRCELKEKAAYWV